MTSQGTISFDRSPPFSVPRVTDPVLSQPAAKTVAIVDDDRLVRLSMGNLIRALGYSVELFASGPLVLAGDLDRFSCVISDMQMPEMTGLMLQAALLERAPALPVIFLTAFPDESARSCALASGAQAFFEKPCDLDELVTTLEEIVGPPSPRG